MSKPDGFITAMYGEEEYVIGNTKRVATHANMDDSVMHWALQLKECKGNIVRCDYGFCWIFNWSVCGRCTDGMYCGWK